MIVINIYTDIRTMNKLYSVESFHNNRYSNTGKMKEKAYESYMKMLKPKSYIMKCVKNPRDLESKPIQSLECKPIANG